MLFGQGTDVRLRVLTDAVPSTSLGNPAVLEHALGRPVILRLRLSVDLLFSIG